MISDLIKTFSQHITKRKTLLIDMCDRCIHSQTVSAIAQRLKAYQESLSESSVAVQMQGGCVSAHAAVIATFQAPAICLELCECSVASQISARQ